MRLKVLTLSAVAGVALFISACGDPTANNTVKNTNAANTNTTTTNSNSGSTNSNAKMDNTKMDNKNTKMDNTKPATNANANKPMPSPTK